MTERKGTYVVIALTVITFSYYCALLLHQYAALKTSNEVPAFEDIFWNVLHGHGLRSVPGERTFLGHHFSPILFLLVPVYAVYRSPLSLLIFQSLAAAAAIYPLWRLALHRLQQPGWALVIAACFPLSRVMNYGVLTGFHMEILYPVLAFWAFLFGERRQWGRFAVAIVLFLTVKEDAAIAVFGLGCYLAFRGCRWPGVITAVAGAVWLVSALLVVIPAFQYAETREGWQFSHFWSAYGDDAASILRHVFNPIYHARVLFTTDKLENTFNAVSVFLFLPLLSWRAIVFLVFPSWFILFGSNSSMLYGMLGYYGLMITPFLFYACLDGLDILRSKFPTRPKVIWAAILGMFFVNLGNARIWKHLDPGYWEISDRAKVAQEMVDAVPSGAAVAAQFDVIARIPAGSRRMLLPVREFVEQADWLIFDLQGNTYPVSREENRAVFENLAASDAWDVVRRDGGFVLLRRAVSP